MTNLKNIENANWNIGNDEGAIFILISDKIQRTPLSKIKPIKAILSKQQIKLHHPVQWEQKYTQKVRL